MGSKIFGIGAAEAPDNKGEIIKIDGVNLDFCGILNDEHVSGNFSTVGCVTKTKKIYKEGDAKTPREKQCWESAKVPFVYFEGELADDSGHPNAASTAALIKFANVLPELPFSVNASVQGMVLKRGGPKGSEQHKELTSTIAEGFSVTARPCNTKCKVWPWNTLEKSEPSEVEMKLLEKYMPKQHLAEAASELLSLLNQLTPEVLSKSLDDWADGGTANLKCHGCSHTETLFKSSRNWPNRCRKCGKPFHMHQFWEAFNQ
jgi:hypothetical protein